MMIEIQRHIEILLLDNDCVIVPGFGGFMAHHVAARYDENDGSFLPPLRSIGFNPQLKMNDSLLVQSYIEAYDISYPEALRRIEDEVSEIRQHLDNHGSYELTDLGKLSMNDEGNITFEPCEAGILTPRLYGLSNFNMERLASPAGAEKPAEAMTEDERPEAPEEQEKEQPTLNEILMQGSDDEEKRHIMIPVSWVRNAVAVAAVILAFVLIPSKMDSPTAKSVQMGDIDTELLIKVMPKASTSSEPIRLKTSTTQKDNKQDNKPAATAPAPKNCYSLVLASKVTKHNANDFVAQLRSEGYQDARVYAQDGKATKVVYGSYESMDKAQKALHTLRGDEHFKQAWIILIHNA